jgi:hypothetical protein
MMPPCAVIWILGVLLSSAVMVESGKRGVVLADVVGATDLPTVRRELPRTVVDQGRSKALRQDLAQLRSLQLGKDTRFDEVEELKDSLLEKHDSELARAAIYFTTAAVYAHSWPKHPTKISEYAKEALNGPLSAQEHAQAYIYIGDAMQIANVGVVGNDLAKARREIVVPYLWALRIRVDSNVPLTRPEIPAGRRVGRTVAGAIARGDPKAEAILKEHEDEVARWNRARFQYEMVTFQETAVHQVAFLYSRWPLATEELRELANEHVGDAALIAKIVEITDLAIRQRLRKEE